jgi:hypothetical protein
MSTAQPTSNKATLNRFHDATNTGDAELISKTIDEIVEPNVLFHAPVPMDATGAQALKQVWAVLLRAFPDLHVAVEDVFAERDKVRRTAKDESSRIDLSANIFRNGWRVCRRRRWMGSR